MFLYFWRFEPKLFLNCSYFIDISKQWISCPKQQIDAKKCVCYCVIQRCVKILVNTVSANVTSLLITPLAPDDAANSKKPLYTCTSQSEYKD